MAPRPRIALPSHFGSEKLYPFTQSLSRENEIDSMASSDERLQVFQKMADADPSNELAHFSLGKIHFEAHRLAEAERSLRRTIELSPQHAQAHRLLGETLLEVGKKDEGIRILKAGIAIAHEKGEFQPRNQMQEALRKAGVEPPMPQASVPKPSAPGAASPSDPAAPTDAAEATGWKCRRCGKPNPRMVEPPFLNELGKTIHDTICQPCWREWFAMSIKVINEYRLNLLNPQHNKVYEDHMKEFLGIDG
jgi:Fe-S cluster biosynthesis and repair protein YggX